MAMEINGGKPPEKSDVVRLHKAGKAGNAARPEQAVVADKVDVS
jgi:hypothetical protein